MSCYFFDWKRHGYSRSAVLWHVEICFFNKGWGFVNGMVASHLLCHSGTINRHSLNGALLS
ncbi:hypothetical protein C3413_28860 [Klebsiella pneumoniae]|nr:hypothetical protein C3413_28860 [Klebsiella pneumoniae]